MDLLQIIKLVSIPKWVKFISLAIIAVFIALAVYVILDGAHLSEGPILQAGMGLLGVLLPLSIAILFLSFYEAGVSPLKKATEKVLIQMVPEALNNLTTDSASESDKPVVNTRFVREHACHYHISLPDNRTFHIELQLNVRKVCAVFNFRMDDAINFAIMEKRLKHTLDGARHEGYTTNNVISHQLTEGRHHNILVMYKSLPADFLWNSAEKLYFIQDLQVMIQSMIYEAGDWLKVPQTSAK